MSYQFPSVETFHATDDKKEQAQKVLEEAAEFTEACKTHLAIGSACTFQAMADELCDLITAAANCAETMNITRADMDRGMDRCEVRNFERGRYENHS